LLSFRVFALVSCYVDFASFAFVSLVVAFVSLLLLSFHSSLLLFRFVCFRFALCRSAAFVAEMILNGEIGAMKASVMRTYNYVPQFGSQMFDYPGSGRKLKWIFCGVQKGEVVVVGGPSSTSI
jgi:hypothetical protein